MAARGLRPRRRFGQNFLHDKNQLAKLVEAAALAPGDLVLEIGPGTGTLTEAMLERGADVIACEIDRDLAELLRDRLGDRIQLIEGDALETGRRLAAPVRAALGDRSFKLVANLPYQAASPLMAGMLIDHAPNVGSPDGDAPVCTLQVVTIQSEVADRLLAAPSTKAYGPLGVIVQAFADVERIATVKPGSFWPAPKVTSAMVRITPRAVDQPADRAAFARFVTELFSKRRKQLGTILGADVDWPEGVEPTQRPEALSVGQLIELFLD